MSLANHLDQVIGEISSMPIAAQSKTECEELCRYVRHQALCDTDRRDKKAKISLAVQLLITKLQEAAFMKTYKNSSVLLHELNIFVGRKNQKLSIVQEVTEKPSDNWTPKDLFKHLIEEAKRIEAFADREELLKGLGYLLEQCSTPRYQRQHDTIKEVWIYDVHPLLSGYKLLIPFRDNQRLRDRLNYLIRGESPLVKKR